MVLVVMFLSLVVIVDATIFRVARATNYAKNDTEANKAANGPDNYPVRYHFLVSKCSTLIGRAAHSSDDTSERTTVVAISHAVSVRGAIRNSAHWYDYWNNRHDSNSAAIATVSTVAAITTTGRRGTATIVRRPPSTRTAAAAGTAAAGAAASAAAAAAGA